MDVVPVVRLIAELSVAGGLALQRAIIASEAYLFGRIGVASSLPLSWRDSFEPIGLASTSMVVD